MLRRRLDFLDQPASFFYTDGQPLGIADVDDPYRKGDTDDRASDQPGRTPVAAQRPRDPKESIDS